MAPRWVVRAYGMTPRWLSSRVVRLTNPSFLIGVVAVVFDDAGRVLVLKHTYHQPRWRLPGGLLDAGEQPFDTAVRETAEEANCDIRSVKLIDATALKYSFDVAVLGEIVKVRPFSKNTEVIDRRFVGEEEWRMLRPDQQQFVRRAHTVWLERSGKG